MDLTPSFNLPFFTLLVPFQITLNSDPANFFLLAVGSTYLFESMY